MIDTREIATAKIVMVGGNGGGGGTSNYNNLSNKPSINGVTLQGNKTSADLNISGMPENPLATSHGGTGNADGYIRTGAQTGSTIGNRATAEGYQVVASGRYSHAGGLNNRAEYEAQMVCGKYNDNKSATLFEVGNGTVSTQTGIQRSNAFEVYSDGKVSFDNGATKYQLTSYNGDFGFYDASGTFHTFSGGSSGDSYAGFGIGRATSVSGGIIDTDIDLQRAPVEGDRLLVYLSETVSNPSSLKTYNNGVAVTTNITFGQTYPVGLAIFRYTPLGWQCLQTIAYSAGTGISITGTTISNSAPQLGMNIGYGEVTSVTDGNIGQFNGNADYLDIDFKVNASPYNGSYTLYLAMGGSTVIMKYATLKDRYGYAYDKDIQQGTILHCLSKVSGTGTAQDPIVVKVIDENVIANPTGTPDYNLEKIKVGSYIYDVLGIKPYEAYSISNGSISIHTADPNTYDGQIIAVNTGAHSGTTTDAWYLNLVGDGSSYPIEMTNADGTGFTDALSENELLFVYVDTTSNQEKAIVVSLAGASGGGASALTDLTDTNITSPTDGQVLTFNSTTGKWGNQNPSGGNSMSKTRYTISSSSWSASANASGYYTYSLTLTTLLSTSYAPNVYISGASDSTFSTDTEKAQFSYLDECNLSASNTLVLYAKTKPTSTFYVYVEGQNA